jgi:hypothetical protein
MADVVEHLHLFSLLAMFEVAGREVAQPGENDFHSEQTL